MIRISRSSPAPTVLTSSTRRKEHEDAYDADPNAYGTGKATFEFDGGVYAHATVKEALVAMQHEKCAFCESRPGATSPGDVEHFRPKAAARSTVGGKLERPGYYWLAYDWENLLFACEQCNRRGKGNAFPLASPPALPRSHHQGIQAEQPVFIDPSREDPSVHIGFRRHVPIGRTPRGEATIEALQLQRPRLSWAREDRLNGLFNTFLLAEHPRYSDDPIRARAKEDLTEALSDRAVYAAMARAAVDRWRATLASGKDLDEP